MSKSWKDASRTSWHRSAGNESGSDIPDNQLQIGCLQRIADATELMARNWSQLKDERDRYERWYTEQKSRSDLSERRRAALRGVITRLQRRMQ